MRACGRERRYLQTALAGADRDRAEKAATEYDERRRGAKERRTAKVPSIAQTPTWNRVVVRRDQKGAPTA